MLRVTQWFVTGLGTGYLPAPGTMGSLLALSLFAFFSPVGTSPFYSFFFLVLLFGLGVYAIHYARPLFHEADPGPIVIDEIEGMLLILFVLPPTGLSWFSGFALFRLFDIWKPPPMDLLERLPGGWGVMADDLLAAVYALGILMIF